MLARNPVERLIKTRATLIQRLKNWQDQASWQDFFDTYWRLIYEVSLRGGLNESDAQEVVQDTMIAVAKHMPCFKYNPAIGSFKTWLLNMVCWRIIDRRRRRGEIAGHVSIPLESATTTTAGAYPLDKLVDPANHYFGALLDAEWQRNLLAAAITNIKRRVDPEKFQIFDLYVNKGWPADRVARTFRIPPSRVYLTKHRVTEMIKEEVQRLERNMI